MPVHSPAVSEKRGLRCCAPRPTHILGTVNDVAYNENHTTSTKRPFVETMASSDKVVVNVEHIAEHGGSLKRAMELGSSRNGPVNYNT